MGFYHSCQAAGSLMSGALQVAITNTLDGAAGLTGWRWLFVINAIMTVVAGALGFVMLPDLPNDPNPRAFWFTKRDARIAMERLDRHGRAEPKKMTWAGAKYAHPRNPSRGGRADRIPGALSPAGSCTLWPPFTSPPCWPLGATPTSACSWTA